MQSASLYRFILVAHKKKKEGEKRGKPYIDYHSELYSSKKESGTPTLRRTKEESGILNLRWRGSII